MNPSCPHCSSEDLAIHSKKPPRYACGDCGRTTRNPVFGYRFPKQELESNIIVITWAQNATPVFKPFLKSLNTYCKKRKAQLLVIPGRYKNPTSSWTRGQENNEWWDDSVKDNLVDERFDLNSNLTLAADIKIQPTASEPMSGLKTVTGALSCIFGHPQIAFETVPTPQNKMAKIVATTGAVTNPNYTDSKAGKKGEFHHEYGALVIELDNGKFHMRQLCADGSGKFFDLDKCYSGDKVTSKHRAEAFVSGDFHGIWLDPVIKRAWWTDKNSLCNLVKPKAQFFHDVLDTYWGSHHHVKDPFLQAKKFFNGLSDGKQEISTTLKNLSDCSICDKNYVVASNHNEHFNRWLKETDWRKDPQNSELYLETSLAYVQAAKQNKEFDPLEYWSDKLGNKKITYLSRWSNKTIKGFKLDLHGDIGPSGARGSVRAFNNIGCKTITGHGHGPAKLKGSWRVGISCIVEAEYTAGSPGGWLHTAAIIHSNGKAQLITCIDGKYTL